MQDQRKLCRTCTRRSRNSAPTSMPDSSSDDEDFEDLKQTTKEWKNIARYCLTRHRLVWTLCENERRNGSRSAQPISHSPPLLGSRPRLKGPTLLASGPKRRTSPHMRGHWRTVPTRFHHTPLLNDLWCGYTVPDCRTSSEDLPGRPFLPPDAPSCAATHSLDVPLHDMVKPVTPVPIPQDHLPYLHSR